MAMLRFGKHQQANDYRTLSFKNYVTAALKTLPTSVETLKRAFKDMRLDDPTVGKLFPMGGNDTLGDCTIAGVAHATTTYGALIKRETISAKQSVEKLYFHLTGGADTGLNELNVLNYWRQNGALGQKIFAYAKIRPKDKEHVKQAINLFGGVYLGFQVQQNRIQEFNDKKPWGPGPLTKEGHAVFAVGYDPDTVTVLTWGNRQQGTWAWWDEWVDEAYAILPPEAASPGFAPGCDMKQLQADLKDVAD